MIWMKIKITIIIHLIIKITKIINIFNSSNIVIEINKVAKLKKNF